MTAYWGEGVLEGAVVVRSPDAEVSQRLALLAIAGETDDAAQVALLETPSVVNGMATPAWAAAGMWIADRYRELMARRAGFEIRADDLTEAVGKVTDKEGSRPGSDRLVFHEAGLEVIRFAWPSGRRLAFERWQDGAGRLLVHPSWEFFRQLDRFPAGPADDVLPDDEDADDDTAWCFWHGRTIATCGCLSMRRALHPPPPSMAAVMGLTEAEVDAAFGGSS